MQPSKAYFSTRQLTFVSYESPFTQKLPAIIRRVQLPVIFHGMILSMLAIIS